MVNKKRSIRLWPVPPPFRNHGNYVVSVAELNRWLAEKAEEAGAYILTETTGHKLLVEDDKVVGVRTGDKGRDKEGGQKGNFEPGSDVIAKATVLAEGCWGHLTGAAQKGLGLAGNDPQVWALGVKEVWEVEKPLEKVIHTLGWPLRPQAKYQEFGGSWIYGMNREGEKPKVSIGFVCGLDNADARLSVHDLLQEFKLHPLVKKILEGGKRVAWGAKAIPEGGYWALPRLSHPGMVICGDAGGMVNVPKLKGIHYAIESGRLAAETIYKQLKAGSSDFSEYETAVHEGDIGKDLYESRNMKQPFAKGLIVGGAIVNAMTVTKGRFPAGHWPTHRDAEAPLLMTDRHKRYPKPDGKYTFDKLSGVFLTGNATRDDAPSHIRIEKRVPREVAEAWQWMCPAGVYEVPEDAPEERAGRPDRQPLQLRPVRRDHRQGRAPDAARGRRRAALPDHLSAHRGRAPQLGARSRVLLRDAASRAVLALLALALAAPAAGAAVPRWAAKAVLADCERGADETRPRGRVRGPDAHRRAAPPGCRCASRCRPARPTRRAGAPVAAPGFGTLGRLGARDVALRLHQARRGPARAGRLPRAAALPLALRRAAARSRRRAAARARAASPTRGRTSSSARSPCSATAKPGRYRYVAFVRNTGRSAAEASSLRVAFGGAGAAARAGRSRSSPARASR